MGICERCTKTRKVDLCPVHRQVLVNGNRALIGRCLAVLNSSLALEEGVTVEALFSGRGQWQPLDIRKIEEVVTGLI